MDDCNPNLDKNTNCEVGAYLDNQGSADSGDSNGAGGVLAAIGLSALVGCVTHLIDKHHEKKAVIKAYEKGYEEASEIYENKFRKQTEEFLSKEKSWKENMEEYEFLLDEYDAAIEELQKKPDKSEDDKNEIMFLKVKKKELKRIRKTES